ncbi:hypothetical protein P3342_002731 [Pyrenophora teres f. teres]|nr:hypothetical protein P3342_002731 [Pyrenophora teres f. teres]
MFTGRTPESLIPRSDSRNPATTCKGITKSGRPCRRPIDAKASNDEGVIAVVSVVNDDSDDEEIGAAAYFCWQHKGQAEQLAAQTSSGPATQLYPLKERNSIDTLVERLGVLDVNEPGEEKEEAGARAKKKKERRASASSRPPRRVNRPPTWDTVQGPLMSVPSDLMAKRKDHPRPWKPAAQRKKQSFWSSLCCGSADNDDEDTTQSLPPHHSNSRPHIQQSPQTPLAPHPQPQRRRRRSSNTQPPPAQATASPQTTPLHPCIPPHLPPNLASTLLAELSKPISPHDDAGYIYIFWLTPSAAGPAPASTASSLLAAPPGPGTRRTSDVMRQFSVKGDKQGDEKEDGGDKDPTILLKIGRANNVHRRMNEWSRQCGYSLSLVRYYPYIPSSSSNHTTSTTTPRKVPHASRVERLIHLELAAHRVVQQCGACGKTHREWFRVGASREGVAGVDEVVRRWVGWDEG